MKPIKLAGLNALLALALLAAACTPAAAPTPTLDPNMLYTAAAQTVIAQLTQNAPPPTPIPTNTLAPTATQLAAFPTIPPLGTLSPLKTSTLQSAGAGGDKCMYITQTPADGTTVKANTSFNVSWRIRNVGTTTWDTTYLYRFYAARNKLSLDSNSYDLTTTVPPNSEIELKGVASASSTAGAYDATWVLTNPQGVNFCSFSMAVNVAATSTASEPTAKPPAEAEVITYSEGDLDVAAGNAVDDHSWATSSVTYNGNEPRQARILYTINKDVPTTAVVVFTGSNNVPQQATQYGDATNAYLSAGILHGAVQTFTVTKDPDVHARVLQLELCVSSVDCW